MWSASSSAVLAPHVLLLPDAFVALVVLVLLFLVDPTSLAACGVCPHLLQLPHI